MMYKTGKSYLKDHEKDKEKDENYNKVQNMIERMENDKKAGLWKKGSDFGFDYRDLYDDRQ